MAFVGSEGQTHETDGCLTFLFVTEQLQFLIGVQGTHWEEGLGRRLVLDWNATVGREHAGFVDELVATNTEVDLAFLTEDTRLVVIAFTTKSWFWSTLGSRGNRGFGWLARSQMFQLFDESKVLGREAVLVVIQIDQTLANRTREFWVPFRLNLLTSARQNECLQIKTKGEMSPSSWKSSWQMRHSMARI
jgi:hypothetical protein